MPPLTATDSKQGRRGRWLGRGKATHGSKESAASDVSQDDASVDIHALGMPSWENPTGILGTMPTTAMPDIAVPIKVNDYSMNIKISEKSSQKEVKSQPQGLVEKSSISSYHGQGKKNERLSPKSANEVRQKQIHKPSTHVDKKLPDEFPRKIPVDDGYHNIKDFENMIIECDGTDSSFGDITYDESIFDDEYYRNRYAHQRNNVKPALVNPGRGIEKRIIQPKSHAPRSPISKTRVDSRMSNRLNTETLKGDALRPPVSSIAGSEVCAQNRKVASVEQEQPMAAFALDKTIKDGSTTASKSSSLCSGDDVMATRIDPLGTPSSDNVSFVWKREGKKWLKIPVGDSGDGNLRAIAEEKNSVVESRGFDDSFSHGSRNTQMGYNDYGIITPQSVQSNKLRNFKAEELERMEQELLDDALQRSLNTVHQSSLMSMSTGSPSIVMSDRSPVPRSPSFPQDRRASYSGNSRMLPPFATPERDRPRAFTDAGNELSAQEREMVSIALERSLHEQSYHSFSSTSNASYESSRSGASFANQNVPTQQSRPPRPVPRVSSNDRLDSSGCHLAMVCGRKPSTRAILNNIDYEEDEEELMAEHLRPSRSVSRKASTRSIASGDRRVGDSAGMTSSGVKLVWKRGPNNVWGKFPESDDDEEAALQEAMKRSLIER